MKTVYAVSSGAYSDYSVHCLFEELEDAKKYVEVTESDSTYEGPGVLVLDNATWVWKYDRETVPYYGNTRIEEFDIFEKGEVPYADAG